MGAREYIKTTPVTTPKRHPRAEQGPRSSPSAPCYSSRPSRTCRQGSASSPPRICPSRPRTPNPERPYTEFGPPHSELSCTPPAFSHLHSRFALPAPYHHQHPQLRPQPPSQRLLAPSVHPHHPRPSGGRLMPVASGRWLRSPAHPDGPCSPQRYQPAHLPLRV